MQLTKADTSFEHLKLSAALRCLKTVATITSILILSALKCWVPTNISSLGMQFISKLFDSLVLCIKPKEWTNLIHGSMQVSY